MNFCVLGAHAWGTALAIQLTRRGHSVSLVPDQIDVAMALASSRENSDFLPGVLLPLQLQIGLEIKPVLMEADVVILACPAQQLNTLLETVAGCIQSSTALKLVITLGEGFEEKVQADSLVHELLPGVAFAQLTALGSAEDLAAGLPGIVSLNSSDEGNLLTQVSEALG